MTDEDTIITALLHDVIEDSETYTLEDLAGMGFNKDVIDALALLTHHRNVPYFQYIENLKHNSIARAVKLADLKHNSDLSCLDVVDDTAKIRNEKYLKAIRLLEK